MTNPHNRGTVKTKQGVYPVRVRVPVSTRSPSVLSAFVGVLDRRPLGTPPGSPISVPWLS